MIKEKTEKTDNRIRHLKVGDKVRCVEVKSGLTIGKEYVLEGSPVGSHVMIRNDNGKRVSVFTRRFVPAQENGGPVVRRANGALLLLLP